MHIVFLVGTTCVGKSTFIEKSKDILGVKLGTVEVGKEMRRRYPPERFRGLGAMDDTEEEVFEIFWDQLNQARENCKKIVLVDGQPRLESQVGRIFKSLPITATHEILWMYACYDEVQTRLENRFKDDPGSRALAIQRIENDRIQLWPVMWTAIHCGCKVTTIHHSDNFSHERFWHERRRFTK